MTQDLTQCRWIKLACLWMKKRGGWLEIWVLYFEISINSYHVLSCTYI